MPAIQGEKRKCDFYLAWWQMSPGVPWQPGRRWGCWECQLPRSHTIYRFPLTFETPTASSACLVKYSSLKKSQKINFTKILHQVHTLYQSEVRICITSQLSMAYSAQTPNHHSPWQRCHLNQTQAPLPQLLKAQPPGRAFFPSCSDATQTTLKMTGPKYQILSYLLLLQLRS